MCGISFLFSKKKNVKENLFIKLFTNIKPRGPEDTELYDEDFHDSKLYFGFQRLKINDVSKNGNQPFILEDSQCKIIVMLNGEIYNHLDLEKKYDFKMSSKSDCEVILYLAKYYIQNNLSLHNLFNQLDGVFAGCIYYHFKKENKIHCYFFRDRFGVRPLYYGQDETSIAFSSELKGLVDNQINLVNNIKQFPPGHYMKLIYGYDLVNEYQKISLNKFHNFSFKQTINNKNTALDGIRKYFEKAVVKRMMSDRPICCLLSGGLDSSLVASVLAKNSKEPIHTFCIGMEGGEDFYYAEKVAEHIGSIHHEIVLSQDEFLEAIPKVVEVIESYDGTTCRASTGQYLVSKYIKEKTNFKVVYVGEGSDELTGGYLYFHNAPNSFEFDKECKRLLRDIHFFDGKRSDRCISHFGLESRVPFLDKDFVDFYFSINQNLRCHKTNNQIEKYLLREAFDESNSGYSYLPKEVLWRVKEAFSDGVSSKKKSWYQIIKKNLSNISDYYESWSKKYAWYLMPYTEELYWYRQIFSDKYGDHNARVLPYFWLPKWSGNITDASARVLDVYKK